MLNPYSVRQYIDDRFIQLRRRANTELAATDTLLDRGEFAFTRLEAAMTPMFNDLEQILDHLKEHRIPQELGIGSRLDRLENMVERLSTLLTHVCTMLRLPGDGTLTGLSSTASTSAPAPAPPQNILLPPIVIPAVTPNEVSPPSSMESTPRGNPPVVNTSLPPLLPPFVPQHAAIPSSAPASPPPALPTSPPSAPANPPSALPTSAVLSQLAAPTSPPMAPEQSQAPTTPPSSLPVPPAVTASTTPKVLRTPATPVNSQDTVLTHETLIPPPAPARQRRTRSRSRMTPVAVPVAGSSQLNEPGPVTRSRSVSTSGSTMDVDEPKKGRKRKASHVDNGERQSRRQRQ